MPASLDCDLRWRMRRRTTVPASKDAKAKPPTTAPAITPAPRLFLDVAAELVVDEFDMPVFLELLVVLELELELLELELLVELGAVDSAPCNRERKGVQRDQRARKRTGGCCGQAGIECAGT